MMISPETYYETVLKGKSEKEIRSAIRGLKNEIGSLKNTMERPDYGSKPLINPCEAVRLSCTRMYLERAKQALAELGATYTLSAAERKAQHFHDNIEHISKIRFEIGWAFSGKWIITVYVCDNHIHFDADHPLLLKPTNLPATSDYPMPKSEFLDRLRELYIGEWRHNYNPERYGWEVLDGIQWSLDFEYSNKKRAVHYHGSNGYPYNFDKLTELFCLDDIVDWRGIIHEG